MKETCAPRAAAEPLLWVKAVVAKVESSEWAVAHGKDACEKPPCWDREQIAGMVTAVDDSIGEQT